MAKVIVVSKEARAEALRRALTSPVGVKIDLTAGQQAALRRADAEGSRACPTCGAPRSEQAPHRSR